MKDFPLPVRMVGAGSQPAEDDELQYLEMPRGMNTFRMPIVPEEAETAALTEARDLLALFLGQLEAHLTAAINEQADELVHNACRELEALLLEQVSDRLKAELPQMIARVIAEHFQGPGRTN